MPSVPRTVWNCPSFSIVDGSFSELAYNLATAAIAGTCISTGHLRIAENSTTIRQERLLLKQRMRFPR